MSKVTQNGHAKANGHVQGNGHSSGESKPATARKRRFGGRQLREWIELERTQRREAIGGLDAAWLVIEKETSFSPVCASTYTYKGMTLDKLLAASNEQMERFPKYKQKLTDLNRRFHGPRFVDDPDFDLRNHVKSIRLKEPAGKAELEAVVSRFVAEPFDLDKPLWGSIFVENYRGEDGADSAMITRGHHTLADGQGFVISQLYITSHRAEIEKLMNGLGDKLHKARTGTLKPSKMNKGLAALDGLQANPVTAPFLQVFLFALYWTITLGEAIVGLFWAFLHALHAAWLFTATSWRMTKCTPYYHGPRVYEREFATSKPFPISDVKLLQKAFSGARPGSAVRKLLVSNKVNAKQFNHVTLNDVVVACMTDVLRRTAEDVPRVQGLWPNFLRFLDNVLPVRIGLFIPISIREPGVWDMKNLSTGATVYMKPMGRGARVTPQSLYDHIHQAKSELSIIKRSILPQIFFNWLSLARQAPVLYAPLTLLPSSVSQLIEDWVVLPWVNLTMSHFTAIITNVPGPKERVTLEGVPILSWSALPPSGGKSTLGIGVMSYGGELSISVMSDHVVGGADVAKRITERFEKHFRTYVECAKKVIEADEQ